MTGIQSWVSAGLVDLYHLPVEALSRDALAGSLSKLARFNGQTEDPWSVAQHSVLVSHLCETPEATAWALLHDAHEAFIGDITRPAQSFIADQNNTLGLKYVHESIRSARLLLDRQIMSAWHVRPNAFHIDEVQHWDNVVLAAEMIQFFGASSWAEIYDADDDINRALECLRSMSHSATWHHARGLWIGAVETLKPLGLLTPPKLKNVA